MGSYQKFKEAMFSPFQRQSPGQEIFWQASTFPL